jgi:hypothetical protein
MVAALVTALGAVIVAFVALLGTRVESRDARTRLTKDVDLMLKLRGPPWIGTSPTPPRGSRAPRNAGGGPGGPGDFSY